GKILCTRSLMRSSVIRSTGTPARDLGTPRLFTRLLGILGLICSLGLFALFDEGVDFVTGFRQRRAIHPLAVIDPTVFWTFVRGVIVAAEPVPPAVRFLGDVPAAIGPDACGVDCARGWRLKLSVLRPAIATLDFSAKAAAPRRTVRATWRGDGGPGVITHDLSPLSPGTVSGVGDAVAHAPHSNSITTPWPT